MHEQDEREFWRRRALHFNELGWVKKRELMDALINIVGFSREHVVLDAGTGTGSVAITLAPLVREIVAIDISPDMLRLAQSNGHPNILFRWGDIRRLELEDKRFDRVVARLVFHHLLNEEERKAAARECYRVLRPEGRFVICEGVPPCHELREDYAEIFRWKERRVVFMPEDLVSLLESAGFRKIGITETTDYAFSVRNWLEKAGTLSEEVKSTIFELHRHGSELFKTAYNLRDLGHDILIDTKLAFVVGEK